MIHVAEHSETRNPSAFQWGGNPPKLPLIMGDANPHLIHGYLGRPHPTRQTPSRSNQPSLHGSRSIIPILYSGTAPSQSQNFPFPWGDADPHLTHGYLGPSHPTRQTPSRSNQPCLHGSCSIIPILYYGKTPSPPQNFLLPWGDPEPHLIHGYYRAHPSPHAKRHLDRCSRFCRIHPRDGQTGRTTTQQVGSNRPHLYAMHI